MKAENSIDLIVLLHLFSGFVMSGLGRQTQNELNVFMTYFFLCDLI